MTQNTITLNNGVAMPALGLGVFQTPPDVTTTVVEQALHLGYRHIDTAAAYANEREVGDGIRRAGIARDDVFIETKVWISDYGYDETLHAFDKSAGKLGVDQLDLFILHQALPSAFDRTLAAYRALEELFADGKVRAIGVSNFMPEHLDRLLAETTVVPAVNQIELHPYFQQAELQKLDAASRIVTQAWFPIGGITSYRESAKSTFDDPTILEIGRQHGKTAAQVMLRWHLQEGRSVIPKSVKPARLAENLDVFDFELTTAEIADIDALDTGVRGGPEPDVITLETFGRDIPRPETTAAPTPHAPPHPPEWSTRHQRGCTARHLPRRLQVHPRRHPHRPRPTSAPHRQSMNRSRQWSPLPECCSPTSPEPATTITTASARTWRSATPRWWPS